MIRAKELLLEDALAQVIKKEREIIKLKKVITILSIFIIILTGGIIWTII